MEPILIQTKLHRPQTSANLVERPYLLQKLNQNQKRPLTLITAPAGYGKSTLASNWAETLDCPTAWVSLDENDNDLAVFLSYFIAAIQTEFPDIGTITLALLNSAQRPPLDIIIAKLINELNLIKQAYVLVLDDYHLINDKDIHDVIKKLLHHMPKRLHLLLVGRIDPPLPIAKLRAKSKMVEIRAQDLRFSKEETAVLYKKLQGTAIDQATASSLEERSEGWVTGLRLAVLAQEHLNDHDTIQNDRPVNNHFVTDYLMSSVFSLQRPDIQQWLLQIAILNRFSPQLCAAICLTDDSVGKAELDGELFIDLITQANLFIIPLDHNQHWFRFHHLFQQFLQLELTKRFNFEEINGLHSRASRWFAQNGLIDEALHHALTANDFSTAGEIVEQYRHSPLNEDKWYVLDKWLNQLPDETVQQQPALLLAKAWISNYESAFWAIPPIIETVERLLDESSANEALWGEVDFFKGILLCWEGQGEASLALLNSALDRTPLANIGVRNEIEIYYALASQIAGQGNKVVQTYERLLYDQAVEDTRRMRLLASIIFVHLLSGDLALAEHKSKWLADLADKTSNAYTGSWASYMLGYCNYGWHNLETAIHYFKEAIEQKYAMDNNAPVDIYAGLIFSYQAMQQSDNANKKMDALLDFVRHSHNPDFTNLALSIQARLALLQDHDELAVRWLKTAVLSFDTGTTLFWIDIPRLNQCRVLIAQSSESSLREATDLLEEHKQFSQATHNVPLLINVLLLQAVSYKKLRQTQKADAALEQAISLARPGGWIQPFVETGTELASMLNQLASQGVAPEYIAQILANIPKITKTDNNGTESNSQTPNIQADLIEQLTYRERDVLSLLAQAMSNQEIAFSLTISPYTVKRHTTNIYRKLDVKNRRQAVSKAEALGIIQPD